MKSRSFLLFGGLPGLAILLLAGCGKPDAPKPAPVLPAVTVQVSAVRAADLPRWIDVTGTVRPVRRAVIAARVMGSITELSVTLGSRVKSGERLLRLDSDEAGARLAQAKTQLNLARRDLERERDLQSKGASTVETVRSLQDRVAGTEAQVREAEAQLAYTELRAPFDGIVSRRLVRAGDFVSPGQALLELEELNAFEVEAAIPESLSAAIVAGESFTCDTGSGVFTGTVKEISSAADPGSHAIGVTLSVPASTPVRSGQFVRIQVPGPKARTLLAPASAVAWNGQMERVFVVGAGSHAALRLVKSGGIQLEGGARWTEILSGLEPDERVVIDPPAGLRDGQPLEVRP